ncbi:MAG: hypothetical protein M3N53_12935 [Actinomycetota bacterium]|nr:hypothetical protein [Actinomycetota bacterium]
MHPEELQTGRPATLLPELDVKLQNARVAVSKSRLDEATTAFEDIKRRARRYGLRDYEARAEQGLALVAERSSDIDDALQRYQRAKQLLAREPLHLQADAVAGEARCYHIQGEKTHAIYLLETFLHNLKKEGLEDPDALIRIRTTLVITYREAGYHRQAAEVAELALALESRVKNPARLGQMHNMVARSLLDTGQISRAEESLRKAAHFYELADLELELGRARLARGILLKERGRLSQARKELSAALSVFVGVSSIDEARANNELSAVERQSGNPDAALLLASAAISIGRDANVAELARSHRERGLALAGRDLRSARASLEEAIELFTRAEERVEAALTHAYLGDLLAPRNQKQAMTAYRRGLAIFESQRASS